MRFRLFIIVLVSAVCAAGIGDAPLAHQTVTRGAAGSRHTPARHPAQSWVPAIRRPERVADPRSVIHQHTGSIQVPAGATRKQFDLSEPSGVIQLLRITVPPGTRANLTGVIPHLAGIDIRAPQSCQHRGKVDICTQPEEACPMPAATWHFRLQKLAGPAGKIRVRFIVSRRSEHPSG